MVHIGVVPARCVANLSVSVQEGVVNVNAEPAKVCQQIEKKNTVAELINVWGWGAAACNSVSFFVLFFLNFETSVRL